MKEMSLVLLMFVVAGLVFATIVVAAWGLLEGNPAVLAPVGGAVMVYLIFGRK